MMSTATLITIIICFGFVKSKDDRKRFAYYKIPGKRLGAKPIQIVKDGVEENCLAVCSYTKRCISFNIRPGSKTESSFCELFDVDRCDMFTVLTDAVDIDYFDTLPTGQCLSKYLLPMTYLLI